MEKEALGHQLPGHYSGELPGRIDYLERISRLLVLMSFAIAIVSVILAPLLALGWQKQPFPGFLIDQTLVVNGISGQGWGSAVSGIIYPERVIRVAGQSVSNSQELYNALARLKIGARIQVFTISPDGLGRLYPNVRLLLFPNADLIRIFWLPYFVGLAYLAIGIWIYRLRGGTRPGRALAFFCIVIAITNVLYFDVSTTHKMSFIWTLALAQVGGALISLAWRFPQEWFPVKFKPGILALPYFISLALSAWGIFTLYDQAHPWAYIPMWEACQRYAGFGSVLFLCVILYHAYAGGTLIVRRQARLMLAGSIMAFLPITIWFIAPLFNFHITFDPLLFLPTLLIFPLSVALAILRFRLWEIDDFVNHAYVYGASTAILAGVFAALTGLTQRVFIATTGAKSDAAVVLTTLIIATAFTPLKSQVQKFVDRHLGAISDNTAKLQSFGEQVQAFVQLNDVILLSQRLLTEATAALRAESGALSLLIDGRLQRVHTSGRWKGNVHLSVPLDAGGQRYGLLQLGPHREDRPYSDAEGEALQQVAAQVAQALSLAWPRYINDLQIRRASTQQSTQN
jgi:hypothetical protein